MVFTPGVRMKHVDRRWKAYPVGNKGESPELSVEQQSANDCLKEKCATVIMNNPGIACLEVARP